MIGLLLISLLAMSFAVLCIKQGYKLATPINVQAGCVRRGTITPEQFERWKAVTHRWLAAALALAYIAGAVGGGIIHLPVGVKTVVYSHPLFTIVSVLTLLVTVLALREFLPLYRMWRKFQFLKSQGWTPRWE
jgi:hypothetical protein